MSEEILSFIQHPSFPCLMAKAVARTGNLTVHEAQDLSELNSLSILQSLYEFIDTFNNNLPKLSSFCLVIKDKSLLSFEAFEDSFWRFLKTMDLKDKNLYPHDPRVSSDPRNERYSYSLKSEALFLFALHPEGPRFARRFKYPAIVFNPHIQFEKLRQSGIFKRVRDLIRGRDMALQGSVNPMMKDFGDRSEIYQYMGRPYAHEDHIPLYI